MLDDLDSGAEIADLTARLLKEAGVNHRLPTPVDDIIAAAKLVQAQERLFSDLDVDGLPEHLRAKMRQMRAKVTAALDRKNRKIYLSADVENAGQRRFKQLHEVTHDLLPWQSETAYADSSLTLSWSTRIRFEREANQGSAELLFQRELFRHIAAEYQIGFSSVIELADMFGASYHATFRRYVESHKAPIAGLVLDRSPHEPGANAYRRKEAVHSRSWLSTYEPTSTWPTVIRSPPFTFVTEIRQLGDLPQRTTLLYPDHDSRSTTLQAEIWSNYYRVFVMVWTKQRDRLKRRRIIAARAA